MARPCAAATSTSTSMQSARAVASHHVVRAQPCVNLALSLPAARRACAPARVTRGATRGAECRATHDADNADGVQLAMTRRAALALTAAAVQLLQSEPTQAVQGITAGRIPGLSNEPDADGFYTYQRPEGKSGGHGVGWSEIPRYSFKVPPGWEETPVSIADLGGTEIDLRYGEPSQGSLQVVVAPVLRFADNVGFNARITLNDLGPPDRLISGFAPELYGLPLEEDDVLDTLVLDKDGVPYYQWELTRHRLVTATAVGNRVFLLATNANGRQWRKGEDGLRKIWTSFYVPPPADQ